MTRAVVIINPLSGKGRDVRQIDAHAALARDVLARHGIDAVVRTTRGAGDATAMAREAVEQGCTLVIAWGGDGTINETARALVWTDAALGIVPAGSGNGLANDLGIPPEPRAALEIAASAPTLAIDAGQVDDSWFFNIAGVGADALIAARFAERGMHRRGPIAYAKLTTAALLRYEPQTYRIVVDDEELERRAILVALANGRQYGNRLLIAPGARLDDGLLEVVIVEPMSVASIAFRLPSLFLGTLQPGRGVHIRPARQVRIHAATPIPYHVDGEPRTGGTELTVQVHPGALKVRAPAG